MRTNAGARNDGGASTAQTVPTHLSGVGQLNQMTAGGQQPVTQVGQLNPWPERGQQLVTQVGQLNKMTGGEQPVTQVGKTTSGARKL